MGVAGAWWGRIDIDGVEMRDGYKMFNARLAPSPGRQTNKREEKNNK